MRKLALTLMCDIATVSFLCALIHSVYIYKCTYYVRKCMNRKTICKLSIFMVFIFVMLKQNLL